MGNKRRLSLSDHRKSKRLLAKRRYLKQKAQKDTPILIKSSDPENELAIKSGSEILQPLPSTSKNLTSRNASLQTSSKTPVENGTTCRNIEPNESTPTPSTSTAETPSRLQIDFTKNFIDNEDAGETIVHVSNNDDNARGKIGALLGHSHTLKEHVVPTLFQDLPVYLASTSTANTRKKPKIRRKTMQLKEAKNMDQFSEAQFVKRFEDFVKTFQAKMNDKYVETKWNFQVKSGVADWLYLLTIECSSSSCESEIELTAPKNECSVFVKSDLTLKLFVGKEAISAQDLNWVHPHNFKLSRWSQLENILVRFPADPERCNIWLKQTKIANWTPTKNARICSKHFLNDCFSRVGSRVRLLDDAVPSVFLYFPMNPRRRSKKTLVRSATATIPEGNPPTNSLLEMKLQRDEAIEQSLKNDIVHGYENFLKDFQNPEKNLSLWNFKISEGRVWFYRLSIDVEAEITASHELKIVTSVSVSNQLTVSIYHKGIEISPKDLKWLFPCGLKLTRWSQLERLLTHYKDIKDSTTTTEISSNNRKRKSSKASKTQTRRLIETTEKMRITEACQARRRQRAHERNLKRVKATDCALPEEVLFIDFKNLPKENLENLSVERDSTSINKINLDCEDDFNSLEIKLEQDELIIKDEPEEVIEKDNSPMNMRDAEFSTFCMKDVAAGTEIKVDPCATQEPSTSQDTFKCRICRQCGFVNVLSDGIGNDTLIDKVKKPFKCQRCHKNLCLK